MLYFDLILPYLRLCPFEMYSNVCTCMVCCSFVLSKCIECMIALFRQDLPEQQPGEGKCPLTHYVPFIYNSLSRVTLFKPKD
jgi:hypothetical protein